MAFPPPFSNPMMPHIPPQPSQSVPPFLNQRFGFFTQRQPLLPGMAMPMPRPRFRPFLPRVRFDANQTLNQPMMNQNFPMNMANIAVNPNFKEPRPPNPNAKPTGPPTITTVFIGNISDKCPDRIVQEIIKKCGSVCNWKRLQDSNGKHKAFGFCDFMYPDGAKKALSVLKDYHLGDKRLNVKADEQTEKMLEEFSKNKKPPVDEESDESVKAAIRKLIEENVPELIDMPLDEPQADDQKGDKSPTANSTKSSTRERKRSRSSSAASHHRHKRSSSKRSRKSHSRKRSRRHSSSSSGSDSASSVSSRSSRESGRLKHRKSSKRKKSVSSDDSVDSEERRRLKKEIKEREESYLARLKKWEEREKRMAKHYEKEKGEEHQRQKTIQKEAKKLRQFLEDYVDERDDPKYYKGNALFQRKRNYEREREADAKDRHEEKKELEEIKKSIMKEKDRNEVELKVKEEEEEEERQNGAETNGHIPEAPKDEGEAEKAAWSDVSGTQAAPLPSTLAVEPPRAIVQVESTSPAKKTVVTTLQQTKTVVAMSNLNGVFPEEEEEVDTLHQIKKKIKRFEITQEDRMLSMTPEERKKLIKDLIARIPTDQTQLFSFALNWEFVDELLMEQRVRPWVNKKICEYIGEEEPSLVSFICDKIASKTAPNNILQDLSMVLDDEAEVFMVKLWRLIVYESEAKRLGLSASSSSVGAISSEK